MTELTEIPETPQPPNTSAPRLPDRDDPQATRPLREPLILFGSDGDELVCVDDTCVPRGGAE